MKKRHLFPFALVAASLLSTLGSARAADDPTLEWRSIETPHFRITYYSGERPIAEHVADLAEAIHARLVPVIGWPPGERTEIVLTDQTDSANGSATALPFDAIRLFVTAPDDLSPLGDVDDWYQELVTHEYTHILHLDHIRGLPALVNKIIGKALAPNQVQPRWVLEGLAVFEETERTSGGRLRSSTWNMFMRADVLENRIATIDEISNGVRRWPQGNIWYLYGSFFMRWIADTYGDIAIRRMIDDYGREIVPYGINRSIKRATGFTFEELYARWVQSIRKDFGDQADAIHRQGVRGGIRITFDGQTVEHPRWVPRDVSAKWSGAPVVGDEILYYRDDAHERTGLYRLPIERDLHGIVTRVRNEDLDLVARTNDIAAGSFEPDGGLVFNSVDVTKNLFDFNDLFELPSGLKTVSGMDGNRSRLTVGFRATDPDVSPDGRHVVFSSNHRGTSYLQIADLDRSHSAHVDGIVNVRPLVPSYEFEQAYAPRYSPDGLHVAYSVWQRGGYRDIRLVDVITGQVTNVTHDRAIDSGPAFSQDGRWLFFHSDRTGVMNIYAYELATTKLKQVTNVINGAYQPAPSPDGKTLVYVGYTHAGYDLFAMPLDESTWPDAPPYVDPRPAAPPPAPHHAYRDHPYDPIPTLLPRKYSLAAATSDYGEALTASVAGTDIANHHSITASLTTETLKPTLQGGIDYVYGRLPFDVTASIGRTIQPATGYQLGQNYSPTYVQENFGAQTGISYSLPRAFDGQSFSLAYSFTRFGANLPTYPAGQPNPYDTPTAPTRGYVGFIHLGYAYSNAEGYNWSVSNEHGFDLSANLDLADPVLASDFSGFSTSANFATYLLMPWLRHHVVALHAGAGMSGGNSPGIGAFYVGGFTDVSAIDTVRYTLLQGGLVLRGYPVVAEVGRDFALFNAEYRFPIVNIDRGPSTLPAFLQRVNGNFFVDYGSAFNDAYTAKFKTGTGAELWVDMTLGYLIDFEFRFGYAHGWASEGIDKFYFAAVVPY